LWKNDCDYAFSSGLLDPKSKSWFLHSAYTSRKWSFSQSKCNEPNLTGSSSVFITVRSTYIHLSDRSLCVRVFCSQEFQQFFEFMQICPVAIKPIDLVFWSSIVFRTAVHLVTQLWSYLKTLFRGVTYSVAFRSRTISRWFFQPQWVFYLWFIVAGDLLFKCIFSLRFLLQYFIVLYIYFSWFYNKFLTTSQFGFSLNAAQFFLQNLFWCIVTLSYLIVIDSLYFF